MYRKYLSHLLLSLVIVRSTAQKPVQLNETTFTAFINNQNSSNGVLMEFYANWCPTCQHFQPDYDKIAYYFNAEPRVQPNVAVARVDCATEVSMSFSCFSKRTIILCCDKNSKLFS